MTLLLGLLFAHHLCLLSKGRSLRDAEDEVMRMSSTIRESVHSAGAARAVRESVHSAGAARAVRESVHSAGAARAVGRS